MKIIPVVLDGGLAVPLYPKPAYAGSNGTLSAVWCGSSLVTKAATKVGSGDNDRREPRQDRKVATVNGVLISHRGTWLEPILPKPPHQLGEGPCTTGLIYLN